MRQAESDDSVTTSDGVESNDELDREERRELLQVLVEGMSPNPEVRKAANETKQKFNDRYGAKTDGAEA